MFNFLKDTIAEIITENFQQTINATTIQINATPTDYVGDCTIVVFPFTKFSKLNPEATGNFFGEKLMGKNASIESFNVVKGFLNIVFKADFWLHSFVKAKQDNSFGLLPKTNRKVMVEYSSPNTNKPLHLGHVRNIFLGHSISEILKASGNEVIKTNLVNDRGIHICKSMLAWQKFGNGETPASSGLKGDHLVGKYYVEFDMQSKIENQKLIDELNEKLFSPSINHEYLADRNIFDFFTNYPILISLVKFEFKLIEENLEKNKEDVKNNIGNWLMHLKEKLELLIPQIKEESQKLVFQNAIQIIDERIDKLPINEAIKMLSDWEAGKPEIIELWKMMNGWVYEGFNASYKMLNVTFDKTYYESNTYLLGKKAVAEGLQQGVFVKDADNSVWIDLTNDGLDRKILQRKDGTSVYITQDIGTAQLKYDDYQMDESIYVVGNEQDYHFKVLQLILKKLGKPYADGVYHMSYGMVELPSGKMKSREGTVVDADDLMAEMIASAKSTTEELGKVADLSDAEKEKLYYTIGMGALKYFLLKVDPKKKMLFNPAESIDFHGHTGPFIQYTHARICSIFRKNTLQRISLDEATKNYSINSHEKKVMQEILRYPTIIAESAKNHDPSSVANYAYDVAKAFSSFYNEVSVLNADNEIEIQFRLHLVEMVGNVIKKSMHLLGIDVPEKM